MDKDKMIFGPKGVLVTDEAHTGTGHYIAAQPAARRRSDSPRATARLAQRRARRGQRVQPAIHTVMKITHRHLARIYGSALRCGVSPAAAEARINMLIREAQDEGFSHAFDAARSADTDRTSNRSDRASDGDHMSAEDAPRAVCTPTAAARRYLRRQPSVEVSSARVEGPPACAADGMHEVHACAAAAAAADPVAGEWAIRNAAQIVGVRQWAKQLADGMASLNVTPEGGEERPLPP